MKSSSHWSTPVTSCCRCLVAGRNRVGMWVRWGVVGGSTKVGGLLSPVVDDELSS